MISHFHNFSLQRKLNSYLGDAFKLVKKQDSTRKMKPPWWLIMVIGLSGVLWAVIVISRIGRPRSWSPILLITRITTDRIGRQEVLLPINFQKNKYTQNKYLRWKFSSFFVFCFFVFCFCFFKWFLLWLLWSILWLVDLVKWTYYNWLPQLSDHSRQQGYQHEV